MNNIVIMLGILVRVLIANGFTPAETDFQIYQYGMINENINELSSGECKWLTETCGKFNKVCFK